MPQKYAHICSFTGPLKSYSSPAECLSRGEACVGDNVIMLMKSRTEGSTEGAYRIVKGNVRGCLSYKASTMTSTITVLLSMNHPTFSAACHSGEKSLPGHHLQIPHIEHPTVPSTGRHTYMCI